MAEPAVVGDRRRVAKAARLEAIRMTRLTGSHEVLARRLTHLPDVTLLTLPLNERRVTRSFDSLCRLR